MLSFPVMIVEQKLRDILFIIEIINYMCIWWHLIAIVIRPSRTDAIIDFIEMCVYQH